MTAAPSPPEFPCANAPLSIDGPAGVLDAVTACPPPEQAIDVTAVVCHPNPLQGGTRDNKVVYTLARAFNELGARSFADLFRGVGHSTGAYANGVGETEDALAVLNWVRARRPHDALWLAGFSFGAGVALNSATRSPAAGLITVAPPVNLYDLRSLPTPRAPWLVVQGDADDVVPAADVKAWIETLSPRPALVVVPGADHFFHRRLNDLRTAVSEWLRPQLRRNGGNT